MFRLYEYHFQSDAQTKGPLIKHTEGTKWYDYQFDEALSADEAKQQVGVEEFEKKAEYWLRKDVEQHEQGNSRFTLFCVIPY